MAHFRGTLSADGKAEVSRFGRKVTGLRVEAQSWQGKVVVELYHNEQTGTDMAHVHLRPHKDKGTDFELYHGPVGGD